MDALLGAVKLTPDSAISVVEKLSKETQDFREACRQRSTSESIAEINYLELPEDSDDWYGEEEIRRTLLPEDMGGEKGFRSCKIQAVVKMSINLAGEERSVPLADLDLYVDVLNIQGFKTKDSDLVFYFYRTLSKDTGRIGVRYFLSEDKSVSDIEIRVPKNPKLDEKEISTSPNRMSLFNSEKKEGVTELSPPDYYSDTLKSVWLESRKYPKDQRVAKVNFMEYVDPSDSNITTELVRKTFLPNDLEGEALSKSSEIQRSVKINIWIYDRSYEFTFANMETFLDVLYIDSFKIEGVEEALGFFRVIDMESGNLSARYILSEDKYVDKLPIR